MSSPDRVTLAMTGASGAQYGLRLLDCLVREEREVHFLISKAAQLVLATETDVTLPPKPQAMQAVSQRIHRRQRRADPRLCQGRLDGPGGLWLRCADRHGGGAVLDRHLVGDCHRGLQ